FSSTDSPTTDIYTLSLHDALPILIGITPAMPTGSSLKFMMDKLPERAFDVGIAEQHAVTLSAGMATQGMIVFCNIYSTFLQRARSEEHTSELQSRENLVCRLLLEK